MHPYIVLNAHTIGKSHIQNNLTCEDYSATYSDELLNIIVISDGHGDKNCFRSEKGARIACEVAIDSCRCFQARTSHISDITACNFEDLVISLETEIAENWKNKVLSDAVSFPFTDKELSVVLPEIKGLYLNGERLEKAYGCTLILSVTTETYFLAIQIGDGKCVAAYPDGVYVEPIPNDENCLGNRSTSLCNSNAKDLFRHFYSKLKPLAAFVSSDGIEESFDQPGLYNCFYSVAYWLKEEGYESTRDKLVDLLPQISEGGSGDDVSLAIMVSSESIITKPRQTLEQIEEKVSACITVLKQYEERLSSANEKLSEKSKEHFTVKNEIAELERQLSEKNELKNLLIGEEEKLNVLAKELAEKVVHSKEQVEKANKYMQAAERFWFEQFDKIGLKSQLANSENSSCESQDFSDVSCLSDDEKNSQESHSNDSIGETEDFITENDQNQLSDVSCLNNGKQDSSDENINKSE